ncbi:5'-methylthioadenosine/S-adenosylhomocysteine nucleosidase [Streptomyces galbus]|nr:5'-methylthioadenosine/S-adenosylhomocysteine nucleosidase [Streptomyces galbus]GHD40566.1 hypothetical protein GCM10010335_41580 [Streptomyces galbus]
MYDDQRPVYLHFLDRELGKSVDFQVTARLVEQLLKLLSLTCSATFYCGISVIWENPALDADCRRFMALLGETDVLDAVSYNGTVEEFYESRQRLYAHDAERYPLYFVGGPDGLRAIRATLHKPQDTTSALLGDLEAWAAGLRPRADSGSTTATALQVTEAALRARAGEAITYSFFHPFLLRAGGTPPDVGAIRRQISLAYSRHYLGFADGDIVTGVKGLSFFDGELSTSFPLYDVPLLFLLLDVAGLSPLVEQPWLARRTFWDPFLGGLRDGDEYRIGATVRTILETAHLRLPPAVRGGSQYAARTRIASLIRQARHDVGTLSPRPLTVWQENGGSIAVPAAEALLASARASLEGIAALLRGGPSGIGHPEYGKGRGDPVDNVAAPKGGHVTPAGHRQLGARPRLLLLTATQVETKCVLDTFAQVLGPREKPLFGEHTTYFRLGEAHGCDIYLAQSEAGASGPGGSILTAYDAFRFLDPALVVMVGIAFGAKPGEQQVGDILVSRQVVAYESQRVGGQGTRHRLVPRGDRVSASPRLLDRCRTVDIDWHLSTVHFGLLLSGEKLIDSADYLDQVAAQFGHEAVGGEMEGAGLYAAAYRQRKEWIVVKAISDWADGKKHERKVERQQLAATRAAQFVAALVTGGGLAPGLAQAGATVERDDIGPPRAECAAADGDTAGFGSTDRESASS